MDIVKKIKLKKELSGIPDSVVLEVLEKYNFKIQSKKDEKIIIKEVRNELRKLVGRFKTSKDPFKLVQESNIEELLNYHSSTRERAGFYNKFKKLISGFKAKSILDLGCGLNPIAIAKPGIKYYAQDIDENNLRIIDSYFKKNKIPGKTILSDLRKPQKLPKADLCLILKVLDILKMPHKDVKELLKSLNCKTLIISFPTITLSGKQMSKPKRKWLEYVLKELNYKFKILKSDNELFYVVNKV